MSAIDTHAEIERMALPSPEKIVKAVKEVVGG